MKIRLGLGLFSILPDVLGKDGQSENKKTTRSSTFVENEDLRGLFKRNFLKLYIELTNTLVIGKI
jgi:hypothetical protein